MDECRDMLGNEIKRGDIIALAWSSGVIDFGLVNHIDKEIEFISHRFGLCSYSYNLAETSINLTKLVESDFDQCEGNLYNKALELLNEKNEQS